MRYEFKCKECDSLMEVNSKKYVPEDEVNCDNCGARVSRMYSPPYISFKGSGFTRGTPK